MSKGKSSSKGKGGWLGSTPASRAYDRLLASVLTLILTTVIWAGRQFLRLSLRWKAAVLLAACIFVPGLGSAVWEGAFPALILGVQVALTLGTVTLALYTGRNTRLGAAPWRWVHPAVSWLYRVVRFGRSVEQPEQATDDGWAPIEAALLRVLTKAAKVKPVEGLPAPRFGLLSHTDDGHERVYRFTLPGDVVFSDLSGLREQVASRIGQPVARVKISSHPDDPPNRATLTITAKYVSTMRMWVRPEPTSWVEPIVIGRDRVGRDLTFPTFDIGQVLIGGRPGAGKTSLLRIIAARYAIDPDAMLYVVDGKGRVEDWESLRPRCESLLLIADDSSVNAANFAAFLDDVYGLIMARNKLRGRDLPGVLVVLEEFNNLLLGMPDKKGQTAVVEKVGMIARAGRAANVQVVIAVQTGDANSFPSSTRAMANVRVSMSMEDPAYVGMILNQKTLSFPVPDGPGEAIMKGAVGVKGEVQLAVDNLTDAAWESFCRSLPPRQPGRAPEQAPEPVDPSADTHPVQHDDDGLPHTARPAYVPTGRRGVGVDVAQPAPQPLHVVPTPAPTRRKADILAADILDYIESVNGTARTATIVNAIEEQGRSKTAIERALKALCDTGRLDGSVKGVYSVPTTADVEGEHTA